jgi:hypothetical protein
MLAVRLAVILATPDVETDAYGHFKIARALLDDPANLHVHWVWLPGYHYLVWALLHAGITFGGLRALNACAAAAGPFLLHDLVARRGGEPAEQSRSAALLAALAFTLAPLSNRLATSAQAETCFTLLVLGTSCALGRRRFLLAGALLAAACLVRYEAWGAVAALAAHRVLRCALAQVRRRSTGPARRRRALGVPIGAIASILPAAAVVAWILVRRAADGEWLTFLRYTHAFASGVRAAQGLPSLVDAVLLPLLIPPLVIGPAIVLVPVGLRRSIRTSWLVPLGILGFLLASYAGRGALGLERYFTALVPFACVAVADGALRLPQLSPRISARAAARITLAAMALAAAGHLAFLVHRARAREAELRGYESSVSR